MLFHQTAHFKFDRSLCRDINALEGFGILSDSGGSCSCFENAKVPEFQPVALPELVDDLVEEALEDLLDQDPFGLGLLGDPVHHFLLRYRMHGRPLGRSPALRSPCALLNCNVFAS